MSRKIAVSIVLLFSFIQMHLNAKEIEGIVKSGNNLLSGVVVTDGTNFAQTTSNGKFRLSVSDSAEFVYIFTPDGYTAPFKSGTPEFYQSLNGKTSFFTFNLLSLQHKTADYALLATADPQTKNRKQFERFEEESITDLKKTIASYKNRNVVGIALGDIVWDSLDLFGDFKKAVSSLNIPFYPVIGNHDYNLNISNMYKSAEDYKQHFGPIYYGFNLGNQHYIVLDDIIYKGNKTYDEDLTDEQLDWLEKYLNYIPKGSELLIAMHAPFKTLQSNRVIPHGKRLLEICKDYKLSFLSGHTHLNSNEEVAPNVIEHNIGALCGTWWTSDVCRDGTPNGYQVFEGSPNSFSWYFKSVGKDRNYQIALFDRGSVSEDSNAVIAKIWNWDSKWKVEWYEDNKYMGEMKQFEAFSPDYLEYLKERNAGDLTKVPEYKQPTKTFFYFKATPSKAAKEIKVVATDRFKKQYIQVIQLKTIDKKTHPDTI